MLVVVEPLNHLSSVEYSEEMDKHFRALSSFPVPRAEALENLVQIVYGRNPIKILSTVTKFGNSSFSHPESDAQLTFTLNVFINFSVVSLCATIESNKI